MKFEKRLQKVRAHYPLRYILFLLYTACHMTRIDAKVLIWDLGYTLFKPNKSVIIAHLGYMDCFGLYFKYGPRASRLMNETLFDLLQEKHKDSTPAHKNSNEHACYIARDPSGRILPEMMVEWLEGNRSCNQMLHYALKKSASYKHYLNKAHERVTENTIHWMFNPVTFAASMEPLTSNIHILKKCSKVKDSKGKPKHSFYILSNFDAESFEVLYDTPSNKKVFKYFQPQTIYISGLLGDIKPRPSFFRYMLKNSNLNPKDCILFDDQKENLKTAQELGMKTILIKEGNHKQILRTLKQWHII